MLHNRSGSFWWFGELFYKLIQPEKDRRVDLDIDQTEEQNTTTPKKTSLDLAQSASKEDASSTAADSNQSFEQLMEQQFDMEEQYEKQFEAEEEEEVKTATEFVYKDEYTTPKKEKFRNEFAKKNAIKMFLSNTGLLSIKDINYVMEKFSIH